MFLKFKNLIIDLSQVRCVRYIPEYSIIWFNFKPGGFASEDIRVNDCSKEDMDRVEKALIPEATVQKPVPPKNIRSKCIFGDYFGDYSGVDDSLD